jgi:hypothetical protein
MKKDKQIKIGALIFNEGFALKVLTYFKCDLQVVVYRAEHFEF